MSPQAELSTQRYRDRDREPGRVQVEARGRSRSADRHRHRDGNGQSGSFWGTRDRARSRSRDRWIDRRDGGGRVPGPLPVRQQGDGWGGKAAALNKQIMKCEAAGTVCELIKTHGADFNHVNVASAMCKVLQVSRVGRLEYSAMRKLEAFSLP